MTKEMIELPECSIASDVMKQVKSRADTGLKKYGVTLDRNDLTQEQWIQHAIEEALDLAGYLTRLKQIITNIKKGSEEIKINIEKITLNKNDIIDFIDNDALLFIKEEYFTVVENQAFFKENIIFIFDDISFKLNLIDTLEVDYKVPMNKFTKEKNLIIRCRMFNFEEKYKNVVFQKNGDRIIVCVYTSFGSTKGIKE